MVCLCTGIQAQNQSNITISGQVTDKALNESIESASIRLLNKRDSSYVTGTTTDSKGNFKLTVKQAPYIVQVSFMGMKTMSFDVNSAQNAKLGIIELVEDGVLLQDAVVTAKAIEILVKGDTVEYNADSYKVQESAVLEDLIKKIPGAEVDANGKITVNGKEISKILVDGKEFFSDDPKVASKNLPAKMIEKLQVLDKRSDLSQLTGFDDGNEETVINLTVKPGMKEGMFGQFVGGYGTKDRYEGNGMLNYMKNNTQLSILGGLNNTNDAGFSDFASSMGGGRGGGPRGISFGSKNGVAKTNNLGMNFATEVKDKLSINGSANFGLIDNDVINESETLYDSKQQLSKKSSKSIGNNRSLNFGTNFRVEWTVDSLTKIIFRPNIRYNKNDAYSTSSGLSQYSESYRDFDYTNDSSFYDTHSKGLNMDGSIIASRRLNSKGRSITLRLSGGYNKSDADGFDYSNSIFHFRPTTGKTDSTGVVVDQYSNQIDKGYNWRATISYVEPIGRNNFLELEYTAQKNNSATDKDVFSYDPLLDDYSTRVDTVSRYMKNGFLKQNITLSFQSIREKFNYTIGIGVEPARSETDITIPNAPKQTIPALSVVNFAPKMRFNYTWSRHQTLRIDYRGSTNQPTNRQLFDGDYTNTATDIERGNPNLTPSFNNNIMLRYQSFNPEKASMFMVFGRFQNTLDDIARVTYTENATMKKVTTYKNVSGNMTANVRMIFNRPLRNRNFSMNGMTYVGYTRTNSFVTQRDDKTSILEDPVFHKNTAQMMTVHENLGLRFTSDMFDFTVRGNAKYERLTNNITDNNRSVWDYGGYADFSLHLPYNFHIESDINYSANSGYEGGYNKNEWLWNASISKDFLKAKNATIRIKMYDILKERSNVSWSSNAEYSQFNRTNTINSFAMFSFIYRFQSFKGGAKMGDMQRRGPGGPGGGHGRPPGGGGRF